nr:protein kinase C-binding protein NELL2-like [Pocillopora verrucosa]
MGVFLHFFFVSVALFYGQVLSCPNDQCRILAFPSTLFFVGERLINHTIANISVIDRDTCEYRCYLDHNCVSVNFYFGENGAEPHNCELNNSTSKEYDKDLVKAANYVYHGTKNFCAQAPCKNYGTCQSGFTRKRYRCLCASGFTGHDCEEDIGEDAENTSNSSNENAICENSGGSSKCICKPGFSGDGHNCTDIDECAEDPHSCNKDNATCKNTEGSFKCSCKPGFIGDGHSCRGLLGFVPEMPAESCGEIKASERRMAVSGRYWLEPQETNMKSKKFLVIKLLFFNHGLFKKR